MKIPELLALVVACACASTASAAKGPSAFLGRPDAWFAGPDAKRAAANILLHQTEAGGWPKNIDTTTAPKPDKPGAQATFDNNATIPELRFLARMHHATHDESHANAFRRGLDYVLKAQYPGGGWPQCHPPPENYQRHITFNDNTMVNLMNFVRDVATDHHYQTVDAGQRKACAKAFDRGIRCILRCQVVVGGKPTAWCAQHDEIDDRPRPARTFELVSLSGSESVGIVRLLMSLDQPDAATVAAIEGAVAWLESVKITGRKLLVVGDESAPGGKDLRLVENPAAPPLWARFYEIGTNRPLFADRDGIPKFALADIGHERRNGYAWYGTWAEKLLKERPADSRRRAGDPPWWRW